MYIYVSSHTTFKKQNNIRDATRKLAVHYAQPEPLAKAIKSGCQTSYLASTSERTSHS